MKIGIVCYPTYGGSGVVATELGKGLAKNGHQVHFISSQAPARLNYFQTNVYYHEVSFQNYPLFEYPPYETALASKIVDTVLYQKLDILHVHYAIPHASAAYLAREILAAQGVHIPFITTLHGTDITIVGKDSTFKPVVEFSIEQSDAVTTVSESLKNDTYANFKLQKEITVIPNFIDLDSFHRQNKNHFKKAIAPNDEFILIHTSNFRPVKRVDDVIRTFDLLLKRMPVKLILVGDGPERHNAELLCRELHCCDHVSFLGKQEAIGELLSVADLFLLPSASESFGLAALEAFALEVPVISSDAGGIPEINIHGKTGYLAPIGDYQLMADYAYEILSNPELLKTMRINALAQAKNFDINIILPAYEELYFRVLSQFNKS